MGWEAFTAIVLSHRDEMSSVDFDLFQTEWVATAVESVLEMSCSFKRRFLKPCRSFPALLCWLSWDDPDTPSDQRKDCCSDLINLDDTIITDTGAKIREWFEIEIRFGGWGCPPPPGERVCRISIYPTKE